VRGTRDRIAAMFASEDVDEAETLLAEELNVGAERERIHFAAIRLSAGDIFRLHEAIKLGRADWRDLLMAADFGHDTRAHERWRPRPLDARTREEWQAGTLPEGVAFRPNDAVSVVGGPTGSRH